MTDLPARAACPAADASSADDARSTARARAEPNARACRVLGDDAVDVGLERRPSARPATASKWSANRPSAAAARSRTRAAPEPEREHRRTARRLGVSAEERHPRRREADRALIDEERHRVPLAQRARHAAHGVVVVDHRHPDALARLGEIAVEQRIRHVPRHRVDRQRRAPRRTRRRAPSCRGGR